MIKKLPSTIDASRIKLKSNICDKAVKATALSTNATTKGAKNKNVIMLLMTLLISRLDKTILILVENLSRLSCKYVYSRKYKKLPADTKKTIPINNPIIITALQPL